jgi:hypothetical protein
MRPNIDVRNFIGKHEYFDEDKKIDYLNDLVNSKNKYSILMCTDFTFPKFGGVETHGYQLS